MNSLKSIAVGLVALTAAGIAAAQTTVRITGSTAFRSGTTLAVENLMGGAGNFKAAYIAASPATNGQRGATYSIYQGNITGASNPVTVICSWAGSVGGIRTLTNDLDVTTWLKTSTLPGTNTVSYIGTSTTGNVDTAKADVTMSDTLQTTTPYPTPLLTRTTVGVVPFVWIKNDGAPSGLNNITNLLARSLLSGGLPLSQFTGNSADTTYVLAVGRDQDSGTRVAALADSGYGSLTAPAQWRVNGSPAITSVELYPATTVLGQTFPIGTAGYASGGNVATAMNATGSSTASVYDTTVGPVGDPDALAYSGAYFVAYVGTGDARSLTGHSQDAGTGVFSSTGELRVLNYNGVPYSFANVREGKYTFWTYQHLMYRSTVAAGDKTVADKIATEIKDTTAASVGIALSSMNVSRNDEGGVVNHN